MTDLLKFGGAVLFALLFAAHVGSLLAPHGSEFTQAALSQAALPPMEPHQSK